MDLYRLAINSSSSLAHLVDYRNYPVGTRTDLGLCVYANLGFHIVSQLVDLVHHPMALDDGLDLCAPAYSLVKYVDLGVDMVADLDRSIHLVVLGYPATNRIHNLVN